MEQQGGIHAVPGVFRVCQDKWYPIGMVDTVDAVNIANAGSKQLSSLPILAEVSRLDVVGSRHY